MTTTIQNNMISLNIENLEVFGFSGLNKQQLEAAINTSVQCHISIVTASGEKIELTSYFAPEVSNLVLEDEHGNEIQSSDELWY